MATLREQKVETLHGLYDRIGVRHEERWRTEAEDRIVDGVRHLSYGMSKHQIQLLGELLHWVTVHAKGESQTSLMAMCDRLDEKGGGS